MSVSENVRPEIEEIVERKFLIHHERFKYAPYGEGEIRDFGIEVAKAIVERCAQLTKSREAEKTARRERRDEFQEQARKNGSAYMIAADACNDNIEATIRERIRAEKAEAEVARLDDQLLRTQGYEAQMVGEIARLKLELAGAKPDARNQVTADLDARLICKLGDERDDLKRRLEDLRAAFCEEHWKAPIPAVCVECAAKDNGERADRLEKENAELRKRVAELAGLRSMLRLVLDHGIHGNSPCLCDLKVEISAALAATNEPPTTKKEPR